MVVPVPTVVRPALEGLVHRVDQQCVGTVGRVARVQAGASVVGVRALSGLDGLIVYRILNRVVQLKVRSDVVSADIQNDLRGGRELRVPGVGVVGRERVRVAQRRRAPVDVRACGGVHVEPHVVEAVDGATATVVGLPVEAGPHAVVSRDVEQVVVVLVVGFADLA